MLKQVGGCGRIISKRGKVVIGIVCSNQLGRSHPGLLLFKTVTLHHFTITEHHCTIIVCSNQPGRPHPGLTTNPETMIIVSFKLGFQIAVDEVELVLL